MEKRKQKGLIIWFISAVVIFIISVLYIIINLYPSIIEIESKKDELKTKLEEYNTLVWKWFNYESFKKLNDVYSSTKDKELNEILNDSFYTTIFPKIDNNLYDNSIYSIVNNSWALELIWFNSFNKVDNFSDFLSKKQNFLKKEKNSEEFITKKNKLKKVLPLYSSTVDENKWLTDLEYISYVENLLDRFDLTTTSQIWIKDTKEVKGKYLDKSSDIYYISQPLKITWTKESILNFLSFIRNTWDILYKNNDFEFSKKFGSTSQLSEVNSLKFTEYIDSSYKQRTLLDSDLLRYLYKTNQNKDIISIDLDLKFYISTLSTRKIYEKINNIIWSTAKKLIINNDTLFNKKEDKYELIHYNYNNLLKVATKLKSNSKVNKNVFYRQQSENIYSFLTNKTLKKDIIAMKKEMKDPKNINKVYKKALKYKEIFSSLDLDIYKIAKELEIENKIYSKDYIFKNKNK